MDTDSKAVEHALSLILNDPHFIVSPKSTAFLSFVVLTTLKGDGHRLKAYTIAVEALDKPDSFDPQQDPSVRVMASRIRAALDLYNSKPNTASIEITMKPGSYMPIFTEKQAVQTIEL